MFASLRLSLTVRAAKPVRSLSSKMPNPTTLLIIGLNMEATKRMSPELDTIKFGEGVEASMDSLNGVTNLLQVRFELDPILPGDAPESTQSLDKVINAGPPSGGPWDVVLFGGGVRRLAPLTELFESLVNKAIVASAGRSKLLFSSNGLDHWDVVRRGCPELGLGLRQAAM